MWYSRLKYKFVWSLNRRLHSIGFPILKYKEDFMFNEQECHLNTTERYNVCDNQRSPNGDRSNAIKANNHTSFYPNDLNEIIAQQVNLFNNTVAIPIQMLLMPMVPTNPTAATQAIHRLQSVKHHQASTKPFYPLNDRSHPVMPTTDGQCNLEHPPDTVPSPNMVEFSCQYFDQRQLYAKNSCDYQTFLAQERARGRAVSNNATSQKHCWSTATIGNQEISKRHNILMRNAFIC